jgi:hypothetical protein
MKRTLILRITLLFLISAGQSPASDARVPALGNVWLVRDHDHQLNLYDFGNNPAWLIQDEDQKWLKIVTSARHVSGDFKRTYDPGQANEYHVIFDGVKPLGKQQIFRGAVDYRGEYRSQVPFAIERDIYREDPFRAMDNTTGRSKFIGPKIFTEYSRKLAEHWFVGASLKYQIESGLKKDFPKPGNTYRNLGLGFGLAYQMAPRTVLGLNFQYYNLQNTLEMVEPGRNETRALVLRKYRGETIFTVKQGEGERFFNQEGYALNLQVCAEPTANWKLGAQATLQFDSLYVSNDRNPPSSDGYWEMRGFSLCLKSLYDFSAWPLRLAFDVYHFQANDWARHPNFDVLLGDDQTREDEIGVGLGYLPKIGDFCLTAAYHLGLANYDKQDYVSRLAAAGDVTTHQFQLEGEKKIAARWWLQMGGELFKFKPDAALNQFSIFEKQHWCYGLTVGLGWKLENVEFDLSGVYGYRNAAGLGQFEDSGRNDVTLLLETKLLKF